MYEATPVYRGRCFLLERHLTRLARGLGELVIGFEVDQLEPVAGELIARNDLSDAEFAVFYVQVTRGVAPRTHAFPKKPVPPTVYAFVSQLHRATSTEWDAGYGAITVPDERWSRADIKTTGLLPNVLAQQAAVEADVTDAVFIRDGNVMEGTHNNIFAVIDGAIVTAPATNHILHGVTRAVVLEIAVELGLPAEERLFSQSELYGADEVFFTGTTTEIRPTVRIDGRAIGTGAPGPTTRQLYERYKRRVETAP